MKRKHPPLLHERNCLQRFYEMFNVLRGEGGTGCKHFPLCKVIYSFTCPPTNVAVLPQQCRLPRRKAYSKDVDMCRDRSWINRQANT